MNYLAHAIRTLEAPWVVAGTSLPDWLRVVDRRARLRASALSMLALDGSATATQVRDGVLRHHDDDTRFHSAPAFEDLSHEAVHALRALSPDPRLRASALGHILVEMLLDAALEEDTPGAMDAYYRAVDAIDDAQLAALVRAWTGRPLLDLPVLLHRFRRARFLFAYLTDAGVVRALEGVCARTNLAPPPAGSIDVVRCLRPQVRRAASALRW